MIRCTDKQCRDGDPIDGQPAPRWAADSTTLCRRCTAALERRLAETPARVDLLVANLGGWTTSRGDGRGSSGWPVPINVTAFDLLVTVAGCLSSWVMQICEERSLRGPDRQDSATLSRWLLSQIDWLTRQTWVDDLADEVRDYTRDCDSVIRPTAHRTRLQPPCPTCGARDLGREPGTLAVDCASCGRSWSEQYLPAFVRLALDSSGGCMTAVEATAALGVTSATFRQWVTRGKVRKLGTVDGTARYSTDDVESLRTAEEGVA